MEDQKWLASFCFVCLFVNSLPEFDGLVYWNLQMKEPNISIIAYEWKIYFGVKKIWIATPQP